MRRWADKIAANVKPPADHVEVRSSRRIRQDRRPEGEPIGFLQAAADDPVVAAACSQHRRSCPFTEPELTLLRNEVEKKYLSAEVIEAKGQVATALVEVERGLRSAQATIRQHAGLDKPTAAALAMARPQQVA